MIVKASQLLFGSERIFDRHDHVVVELHVPHKDLEAKRAYHKAYSKQWAIRKFGGATARARFYNYRLTPDQFEAMAQAQGNVCAICQKRPIQAVDHCHVTKVVRGLLCRRCNTALAAFGDDIEGLQRAITYLSSYPRSP